MSDTRKAPAPREALTEHYRSQLEYFGPTVDAVNWSSPDAQARRFRVLAEVVGRDDSVVDLGCGLGHLLAYLRAERRFAGRYLGVDLVPEFIDYCRAQYASDPNASFSRGDAGADELPRGHDCYLVCGAFNNLMSTPRAHLEGIRRTIRRMYEAATKVVAFNCLSAYTDDKDSALFYVDPAQMLSWCTRHVTSNLTLRHDYNLDPALGVSPDFTLYLYKRPWAASF